MKSKDLILFTSSYPYGSGEVYVENELKVLKDKFRKIYLVPVDIKPGMTLPLRGQEIGFTVLNDLAGFTGKVNRGVMWKYLSTVLFFLLADIFYNPSRLRYPGNFLHSFSIIVQAMEKAQRIYSVVKSKGIDVNNTVFYSFWFNDGAIICALLKRKKWIPSFVFKVHGYDVFEDRRESRFIPFKGVCVSLADGVYTVASNTFNYISSQFGQFRSKIRLFHLGVFEAGSNPPVQGSEFTIVSCSSIVQVKRLDLIVDAIGMITFPLRWIHIGDGPLEAEIKKRCEHFHSNITVEFKGYMDNEKIMDFYSTVPINLCILVSDSEGGVPVALQEACSFGIPLMGRNTGGIPDIVNDHTGVLLPFEATPEYISARLEEFHRSDKNSEEFRINVKEYWRNNFDARENYSAFFNSIEKITN